LLDIEPMSPVFPVLGARFHRELQAGRNMGDSVRTRRFALFLVALFAGASDAAPLHAADSLSLLQSEVHGTSQPVQLPSVASEDTGSSPSSEEERDAKRRRELESQRQEEQQFRDFADGKSSTNWSSLDDA
jgi:hypothetical protein